MANPLLLKISVANSKVSSKDVDKIYEDIERNLEGAQCYHLDRTKVTAAAIEFVAILTSAAAIATIANVLYQVWKRHRDEGQLYVAVDPSGGVQIMISEGTAKVEIEELQKKINRVHASGQLTQMDQEMLEEIKRRRIWIRTK